MSKLIKRLNRVNEATVWLFMVVFFGITVGGSTYLLWRERAAIRNDAHHYVFECRDSSFNLLFKFTNKSSDLGAGFESGSLAVKLLNSNEYVWIEQTGCPYIIELGRFKQSS